MAWYSVLVFTSISCSLYLLSRCCAAIRSFSMRAARGLVVGHRLLRRGHRVARRGQLGVERRDLGRRVGDPLARLGRTGFDLLQFDETFEVRKHQ